MKTVAFILLAAVCSGCAATQGSVTEAGYPHSPRAVEDAPIRQQTRTEVQVNPDFVAKTPRLSSAPAAGMIPVWLAPYQDGNTYVGGQWIWVPSTLGVAASGPKGIPTAPAPTPKADPEPTPTPTPASATGVLNLDVIRKQLGVK